MPKVSVSLPDEVLKFIDTLGSNRSGTIVNILKEHKEKKEIENLRKEYEEYAKFVEANDEDWKDWETTAAHDVGKDL